MSYEKKLAVACSFLDLSTSDLSQPADVNSPTVLYFSSHFPSHRTTSSSSSLLIFFSPSPTSPILPRPTLQRVLCTASHSPLLNLESFVLSSQRDPVDSGRSLGSSVRTHNRSKMLNHLALLALTVSCASAIVLHPRDLDAQIQDTYDYVVVGCGIAGLVVSNRLSEDPNGMDPHCLKLYHLLLLTRGQSLSSVSKLVWRMFGYFQLISGFSADARSVITTRSSF